MVTTGFTALVGCEQPIQQAPMGGVSTPELAAAVSRAGGLGMLAAVIPDLAAAVDTVRQLAPGKPVGVNFLMPFFDRAVLEEIAPRVGLVEWFWGPPDPVLVGLAHAAGALAAWQVGSRDEAIAAADAGCDLVVAQGTEAGGHVRGTVGLLPLLDAVVGAVDVPVVAAGGIGSARGVAAVLAAGAGGARIGTRFVATHESDAHPEYQQALVEAGEADTALTETFSVWWPDAPHRVLVSAIESARDLDGDAGTTVAEDEETVLVPRFAVRPPDRLTRGAIGAMALYAGQSVGAVKAVMPAAEVVRELADGAAALLAGGRAPAGTG